MADDIIRKRGARQAKIRTLTKDATKPPVDLLGGVELLAPQPIGDGAVPKQKKRGRPVDPVQKAPKDTRDLHFTPGEEPGWYLRWEAEVRAFREAGSTTFASMSIRAGKSSTYISNTLKKRRVPKLEVFLSTCEQMGIPPSVILQDVPEKVRQLVLDLMRADPSRVDRAVGVARDLALLPPQDNS